MLRYLSLKHALLTLIFALAQAFIDAETGLLRVADGKGFQFRGSVEGGKDLFHRLLASRAMRQRLGRDRAVQREPAPANLAVAFAQFVFVERHGLGGSSSKAALSV